MWAILKDVIHDRVGIDEEIEVCDDTQRVEPRLCHRHGDNGITLAGQDENDRNVVAGYNTCIDELGE